MQVLFFRYIQRVLTRLLLECWSTNISYLKIGLFWAFFGCLTNLITCQSIVPELFKHLKDLASLRVRNEKKIFCFRFQFFVSRVDVKEPDPKKQGWEKPRFSQKNPNHLFFCFFYLGFFGFFEKKDFVLFSNKTEINILNCCYSIMQYRYFQNYAIATCYTYYDIQNWGERNVSHPCFCNVLLVSSHLSGKAWQAWAQQTNKIHSAVSTLCACPASSASA